MARTRSLSFGGVDANIDSLSQPRRRSYSLNDLRMTAHTAPLEIPCFQKNAQILDSSARVFRLGELFAHMVICTDLAAACFWCFAPPNVIRKHIQQVEKAFDKWKVLMPDALHDFHINTVIDAILAEVILTAHAIGIHHGSEEISRNVRKWFSIALVVRILDSIEAIAPNALDKKSGKFVLFRKEVFDKGQRCTCGLCRNGRCLGILRPVYVSREADIPAGTPHWSAHGVFRAGIFSRQHSKEYGLASMRIEHIAVPLNEREDCCVCYEPATHQTVKCHHAFCSTCLVTWAKQPAIGVEVRKEPTCPACRQDIVPVGEPYVMFAKQYAEIGVHIRTCFQIAPWHKEFGIERGWEKKEVGDEVRLLNARSGGTLCDLILRLNG